MARTRERRAPRAAAGDDRQPLEGFHAVLEALKARRRPLYRLRLREGLPRAEDRALREAAREAGVPVQDVSRAEAGGSGARAGVVLDAGALPDLELADLDRGPTPRTLVALDGVEDPQNLGAIARVAEAAGVAGLVVTRRRAPPLGGAVARASAGAIDWLPVARVANLGRALAALQDRGYWLFGADPDAEQDLFSLPDRIVQGSRVVVLGAEERGLRPSILQQLDHRVRIPMVGRVASLNVSTAAAVVLFELRRRSPLPD